MPTDSQQSQRRSQLIVEPGTQMLVSVSSMQEPLAELPDEAYQNLLVLSTKSPRHVEERLGELGVPVSNVGLLPLAGTDHEYDGPLWTTRTVRPNDPTGISIAFATALEHLEAGVGHILVEDLNVLTMYVRVGVVCRLLSHLASKAREKDLTGYYGLARSAVGDDTFRNLRQSVDTSVDLRS